MSKKIWGRIRWRATIILISLKWTKVVMGQLKLLNREICMSSLQTINSPHRLQPTSKNSKIKIHLNLSAKVVVAEGSLFRLNWSSQRKLCRWHQKQRLSKRLMQWRWMMSRIGRESWHRKILTSLLGKLNLTRRLTLSIWIIVRSLIKKCHPSNLFQKETAKQTR